MAKLIPRTLTVALLGAFVFSTLAHASEVTKKNPKIESIRIVPKQERGIASEDDGFIPLMQPKPQVKKASKSKKKPQTTTRSKTKS